MRLSRRGRSLAPAGRHHCADIWRANGMFGARTYSRINLRMTLGHQRAAWPGTARSTPEQLAQPGQQPAKHPATGRRLGHRRHAVALRQFGIEAGEEVVGRLLGRHVDDARADLGDLAADAGVHGVVQHGLVRPLGFEPHLGLALAVAGGAALGFEVHHVGVRRVQFVQPQAALELGLDRADGGGDADVVGMLAVGRQALAAGDGELEQLGVIERVPGLLLVDGQGLLLAQLHGGLGCGVGRGRQAPGPGLPGSRGCGRAGSGPRAAAWP